MGAMATGDPAPDPAPAAPGPHGWWPTGWAAVALAVLAIAFLAVGLVEADRDTITVDEAVDLTSGISALVRHDARSLPEHPLLGRVPDALPALLAHPIVPDTAAWRRGDGFTHSEEMIRANQAAGRLHRMVFLGRLVPLVEALGCALLMYALAARLFGPGAGLLAGALWLTTPVVVGTGHLVSIDVAFTLAALAVALGLLRFLEHRDLRRAAWLGGFVGLALATRHTALVLLAVAVVTVAVLLRRDRRTAAVAALLVLVVAFATLFAVYRVVAPHAPGGAAGRRLSSIAATAPDKSATASLVNLLPAPQEWRSGFDYLVLTSAAKPSYLFGQSWNGGRWWYFPGTIVLKEPLGALLLLLAGPWAVLRLEADARRRMLVAVVLPAVGLFAFVMAQPLDLGVRLVLPSLALWMVAASGVGAVVVGDGRATAVIKRRLDARSAAAVGLVLVMATQVWASAAAVPNSLAWTPPPFQPGYRWVSDALGQDLGRLDTWSRGKRPFVAVERARGLDLPVGGRPLVGADPRHLTGWVAADVNELTRLQQQKLGWLRRWCPVGTIGGTILLYRFATPPGPRPGRSRPPAPCASRRFSAPHPSS